MDETFATSIAAIPDARAGFRRRFGAAFIDGVDLAIVVFLG